MNDFSELENQLRKLRPVQSSENLTERIEHALTEPITSTRTAGVLPGEGRVRVNPLGLGLGLAAAALLLIFARFDGDRPVKRPPATASTKRPTVEAAVSAAKRNSSAGDTPTTRNGRFVPAGLTQVVYQTRDEGLLFPAGSEQPMRRLRSQTRETLQWRNPNTGASLCVSYPSEEVTLVPVFGQ